MYQRLLPEPGSSSSARLRAATRLAELGALVNDRWSSHLQRVMPEGLAFDNGVLLQGADAVRLRESFLEAALPAGEFRR